MSTIALAAIVKNESKTIRRMLESVKPFIDAWCIVDTGSSDDTASIVAEELADKPGELLAEDWVDFSWNRNSLLAHARKLGTDYLLLLDSDHELVASEGAFDNLTASIYLIKLHGALEWYMPYLIDSKTSARYVGSTHEYLSVNDMGLAEKLAGVSIKDHGDGGSKAEKFVRDQALLSAEMNITPRSLFYLAQTEQDLGHKERAIELYRWRIEVGGWDEESYITMLRLARLTDSTDDYLRTASFRSCRNEARAELAKRFNEANQHALVLALGEPTACEDILFVEPEAAWKLTFERGVALWWTGDRAASHDVFTSLLENPAVSDHYRSAIEHNLTFFAKDGA